MEGLNSAQFNFYGLGTNEWIGIILPFEAQKDQCTGKKGFGFRYRVAIMGYHPLDNSITDEEITYALVGFSPADGGGGGSCYKTSKLTQGDVVLGKFLDGENKQLPIILNVLGRTGDIQYGSGRFDPKTGFVGSRNKTSLTKNQETCEQKGICTPRLIPGNGKQGRTSAIQE